MMGLPVVVAPYGKGLPVTESANDFGLPVEVAANRIGLPVNYVSNGAGLAVKSAAYVFANTEASDLVARFSTPPTNARKSLIDALIGDLKAAGVWTKLDALYIFAAADEQSALLNWKSTSYNLTKVSSPVFTVDRGFQGDGVDDVLTTGFNPATAGGNFAQNSAHLGVWSRTNIPNGASQSYEIGNTNSYIARGTGNNARGRPNTSGDVTLSGNGFLGHRVWSRTASNAWAGYIDGAPVTSGTDASAALTSSAFRILSVTASLFGTNQHAAAHWGSGLTATETSAIHRAVSGLLAAVGAA